MRCLAALRPFNDGSEMAQILEQSRALGAFSERSAVAGSPRTMALIEFAPLNVPLHRRLQTAAVLFWVLLPTLANATWMLMLWFPWTRPLILGYVAVYMLFDHAAENGGRKVDWFRRLPMWRWFCDYFPVSLIKTTDLDPNKSYVFGYHPHGILGLGAVINFATEANDISKVLKGINLRVMTFAMNFTCPFFRELILALGMVSVSRRSCDNILSKGPGNGILIVVGGAAEALNAFPKTYDLVIKKRFGFVKVALRHGASLVPVFSFGENDIWGQVPNPKGSLLRKVQNAVKRVVRISPPLVYGRGVFQYSFGLMPFRRPIVTIIGTPIDCPKIDDPTDEQVREYHQKYLDGLQRIYDEHKDTYAPDRIKELTFE
ncbi:diacylglycerol acyltransferase [Entophlyctis helioformis]|nr:diacylglycerol acyltransferase [Entophlyctis helioformis]